MEFLLKKKKSFTWPIKFKTPSNGSYDEIQIKIEFKSIRESEMKKIFTDSNENWKEICSKIVVGWTDVLDESGEAIPFNKENFDELLENFGFAAQICTQYMEAYAGAIAKN